MERISKWCSWDSASDYQEWLYEEYDSVRLVKWPQSLETGEYVWHCTKNS